MKDTEDLLRFHRNESRLTQSDVAYLLNITDESVLSRREKGERPLNIELILGYHLLFDVPIHDLFSPKLIVVKNTIQRRIEPLRDILMKSPQVSRVRPRLEFLERLITRLSETNAYDR